MIIFTYEEEIVNKYQTFNAFFLTLYDELFFINFTNLLIHMHFICYFRFSVHSHSIKTSCSVAKQKK